MAALAAGIHAEESETVRPPKLVRQRNRLSWYNELEVNGYALVCESVVKAFNKQNPHKDIACPDGYVLLVLSER